jgi:hypothetical protein
MAAPGAAHGPPADRGACRCTTPVSSRARGHGQLHLKIGLALLERSLLKILQQKWTKWIIGKL